jgi:hypothetical protein
MAGVNDASSRQSERERERERERKNERTKEKHPTHKNMLKFTNKLGHTTNQKKKKKKKLPKQNLSSLSWWQECVNSFFLI